MTESNWLNFPKGSAVTYLFFSVHEHPSQTPRVSNQQPDNRIPLNSFHERTLQNINIDSLRDPSSKFQNYIKIYLSNLLLFAFWHFLTVLINSSASCWMLRTSLNLEFWDLVIYYCMHFLSLITLSLLIYVEIRVT